MLVSSEFEVSWLEKTLRRSGDSPSRHVQHGPASMTEGAISIARLPKCGASAPLSWIHLMSHLWQFYTEHINIALSTTNTRARLTVTKKSQSEALTSTLC